MALTLNEIRDSGLLELYVLGDLAGEELKSVEEAIGKYPELRQDIYEISKTLEVYAKAHALAAPVGTWDTISDQLPGKKASDSSTPPPSSSGGGMSWGWPLAFFVGVLLAGYFINDLMNKNTTLLSQNTELTSQLDNCEDESEQRQSQLLLLEKIQDRDNSILIAEATPKYPETQLYFYNNETKQTALLQIKNLPELEPGQSFQLWSLKEGVDPIPLDVFGFPSSYLIEVQFVGNSNAYAITIEPEGGSQVPTLDNLIAVFTVA